MVSLSDNDVKNLNRRKFLKKEEAEEFPFGKQFTYKQNYYAFYKFINTFV